jgi:Uma2 family endonuclease
MASVILADRHFTQPPYPVWQFTVDDYHRLIETGILGENDRVELLEGWIAPKRTHNPPHDSTIQIVTERLAEFLPRLWKIRIQSAVTTTDSEPEPDLAVVRGHARTYSARHPGPPDIGLLIEVAESSLIQDREDKARIYARAGIPTYWIIDLVDARIEVFNDPTGPEGQPAYRGRAIYTHEELVPLILDETEIARIPAKDLLP